MRLFFWSILCFTLIIVGKPATARRATRALAFRKGSSMFYRMNYKVNVLPQTKIFAQAAGFKMVWELPVGAAVGRRNVRSVHDVHEGAELVYESHGFDGRSCLLKNICQALEYVRRKDGVIAKILRLLAGSQTNNGTSDADALYCDVHARNCPLQLTGFDNFIGT